MEYRQLGRTGIQVSAFGLGVMTFGGKTPAEDAFRQLDMALADGITLFDTAENYPTPISPATQGRSEQILGQWIATRGVRDKVVVATKVAGPGKAAGDLRHIRGDDRRLDRQNIIRAVDDSLRRLGTDYIDLYQVHWPERPITTLGRTRFSYIPDVPTLVPIEETLGALGEVIASGKVRHAGVANETAWGVMRYLTAARELGLPRIVTIQNSFSLLDRQFEVGLAEVAIREQVGLLAYSPLARGLLTGKYLDAAQNVAGRARFSEKKLTTAAAYVKLARRYGLEASTMALALVRQKPFITSVLMAASNAEQLKSNLLSIDVTLSKELIKEIDSLHDEMPNPR